MPDSLLSRGATLLLAVVGCALTVPAMAKSKPSPGFDGPLTVHLRSDSITLRMAKAPQLYLAGTINAAAVEQLRRLLQSDKAPPGTDVYLDSSTGDAAAGMELGRLFRAARFNTHLGTWHTGSAPALPATCLDACAYAWLGGVYRWSPSGTDRIGLHENLLPNRDTASPGAPSPTELRSYIAAMDVRPEQVAQVSNLVMNGIAWWNTEQLLPAQVANNGRLPLEASYQKAPGDAPTLLLSQIVRGHENQVTLQCAPGQITVSARYAVGGERAPNLAARAMYAYFEVGGQAWEPRLGKRPQADGDALVFERQMPFAQLAPMLHAGSLAAWIEITGSPVRLGFWIAPSSAEKLTQPFYADCQALQPGYVPPKAPAEQAKPSFWKRITSKLRHQ
ncbi:hypothetical protein ABQJ54_01750 [Rhodanobacter sp. Si-c]|uniref:Uncharacterized protein n=1 Tax=Rhodanobacter lycopersici TaxID=3162487 RepID=A0ABV3QA63_9GAMM